MIVSLFALAVGTISLENPGIRLELFLTEVSKQTGDSYHCVPYLNNEVLAVSFHDQPVETLRSQLARVIHGTWERKEDGWMLIQTSDQKKEEEKWVWENRNRLLQEQIDGLKALAPKSEWTVKDAEKYWSDLQASKRRTGEGVWNSARRIAFKLQSPDSRFCAAIATQLTTKMFTEDPLRVNLNRYSVRSLPGHIELPINIDQAFRQYLNEQKLSDMLADAPSIKAQPAHVELQYFSGERQFLMFALMDKDWKYLGTQIPGLYLNIKGHPVEGESFPLSQSTRQIMDFAKEISSQRITSKIFEKYKSSELFNEVTSVMSQATKRDPLGIIHGRCWIDFANSVKKPLLVSLKDDEDLPKPAAHVPTIMQKPFVVGMMRDDTDGWVLGRPINPQFNRAWRADRSLIESYAKLVKRRDDMDLYAALRISLVSMKLLTFSSGIPNNTFLLDDLYSGGYLMAALGSMSDQQIKNCFAGDRYAMEALPQEGREILNMMALDTSLCDLSPLAQGNGNSLCPLYYLPQGTKGMILGATLKTEPEFRFEKEPFPDYSESMDASGFAALLKEAGGASSISDLKFTVGSRQTVTATLSLGNKSKNEELSIPVPGKNLPIYTWKTLPDDLRKLVLDAMKD